jgi:RNA polymerase sigma factor (sigma-70 family)
MEAAVERRIAFEEFYRAQRPGLLRAVSFTIDDRDTATEVTDEALTRAYERWPTVATMANPTGWTYRVAINLAHNRRRRKLLEQRRALPADTPPPGIDGVADPALARAIATLPLDQRAVVVLRYHLDWSIDHVADALDIPTGTVKSRLHRALQRLEQQLGERP